MADALVVAHAQHHVVDVGPDGLAHRGHGVDERELGGQEGVAGVLDGLRRGGVGDHQRRRHADVERGHPDGGSLVVAADDDAVGVEEVVDRRALPQELRVRHHVDVAAPQGLLDLAGRAHRHGRLVHHDRLGGQQGGDLPGGGLDVAEVGGTVAALGGGHAQVVELALGDGLGGAEHEAQPTGLQALAHQLLEAGLEDGDLPPRQPLHLLGDDVGADHVVAQMGEARTGRETDVPGPDDRDVGHVVALPPGPTRRQSHPSVIGPRSGSEEAPGVRPRCWDRGSRRTLSRRSRPEASRGPSPATWWGARPGRRVRWWWSSWWPGTTRSRSRGGPRCACR